MNKSTLLFVKKGLRLLYGGFIYSLFGYPYIGDIWNKKLKIKKSDLVLEIGPGWNPSIRSDVLVEKYLMDRRERRYTAYMPKNRTFIVAEGCNLPFADNSFDYVICRHVIEHLENPELLLNEIKRVANKGYISAPCGFWESKSPGGYHRWFVFVKDNILILERKIMQKDRKYYDLSKFKNICREIQFEFDLSNPLMWQIIERKPIEKFIEAQGDDDYIKTIIQISNSTLPFSVRIKRYIEEIIRDLFFAHKRNINIFDLLVCPACHSKMFTDGNKLRCPECRREFPIINGIPILILK